MRLYLCALSVLLLCACMIDINTVLSSCGVSHAACPNDIDTLRVLCPLWPSFFFWH